MDTSIAEANDVAYQRLNKAIADACEAFRQETGMLVHGVRVFPRGNDHVVLTDVGWISDPELQALMHATKSEFVELLDANGNLRRHRIS